MHRRGYPAFFSRLSRGWTVLIWVFSAALICGGSFSPQGGGREISWSEYRALIQEGVQLTRRLAQDPQSCAAALDQFADRLAEIRAVRMPDGTVVEMNSCCGLDSALRVSRCDPQQAERYLLALCPDCAGAPEAAPPASRFPLPTPSDSETTSRPCFGPFCAPLMGDGGEPGGAPGGGLPLGGLGGDGEAPGAEQPDPWQWLRKLLQDWGLLQPPEPVTGEERGSPLPGTRPVGEEPGSDDAGNPKDRAWAPAILWLWVALGCLGGALLLWGIFGRRARQPRGPRRKLLRALWEWLTAWFSAIRRGRGKRRSKPPPVSRSGRPVPGPAPSAPAAPPLTGREAVRALFLALLKFLDRRGRLRFDLRLTNYELLREIRDDAGLAARLAPVVAVYDRVWYGHQSLSTGEYGAFVAQIRQLRQLEEAADAAAKEGADG